MKKLIASIWVMCIVILLTACTAGQKEANASESDTQPTASAETVSAPTILQATDSSFSTEAPVREQSQDDTPSVFTSEQPQEEQPMTLQMTIGNTPVSVAWEENDAVQSLKDLCRNQPLTIDMSMYGGFEQVGSIGSSLPTDDVQITTSAGDIVLYSGNQMVVFYGSNTWAYTRLGHITDQSIDGMTQLLSNGDTTITLSLGLV